MRTDYTVHCGPALIIPREKIKTNIYFETCSNHDCKMCGKELHSKFCPECGSKKVFMNSDNVNVDEVSWHEFLEHYDHWDELRHYERYNVDTEENEQYGFPNESDVLHHYSFDKYSNEKIQDISDIDTEASIKDFKEKYKEFLKDFKEFYDFEAEIKYVLGGFFS